MIKKSIIFTIILLSIFSTGLAGTVFTNWIGPEFQYDSYLFQGNVVLTNPDSYVCIEHNVKGIVKEPILCTNSGNDYFCRIPKYEDSLIEYSISSYSNTNCNHIKTSGPTGSFNTSPTIVEIVYLKARTLLKAPAISYVIAALLILFILLGDAESKDYWSRRK